MTYYITICDERERVIQAILIDSRVAGFANGNVYREDIDEYLAGLEVTDIVYKIETEYGVLAGFFVYNTVSGVTQQSFRRAFLQYATTLQTEISDFIASGIWAFDTLYGNHIEDVTYSFREYDPSDYTVQQYDFIWLDELERVVQAVMIDSGELTPYVNGNVVRAEIDDILVDLSGYDIAYKIENQQGVLVGFFAYGIEEDTRLLVLRRAYLQFGSAINTAIDAFIMDGAWRFDYLNQPVYIRRTEYNMTDYNPNDYIVQMYSMVKLDYEERTVQAVLIDNKTQFLTVNANGNVIRAELDDFMVRLEEYRIVYKIENQQGVLVGFFAADPCIEGEIIALRRPFIQYQSVINQAVQNFVTSGVWQYDLLNIEPCPPADLPCYFTINGCYATLNGCVAIVEPKKKFVKRYF